VDIVDAAAVVEFEIGLTLGCRWLDSMSRRIGVSRWSSGRGAVATGRRQHHAARQRTGRSRRTRRPDERWSSGRDVARWAWVGPEWAHSTGVEPTTYTGSVDL